MPFIFGDSAFTYHTVLFFLQDTVLYFNKEQGIHFFSVPAAAVTS